MRCSWIGCVAGLALAAATAALAADCGAEAPCRVGGGEYMASVPSGTLKGAILFLHGYGGSDTSQMQDKGLLARFNGRGYAVIAPSGLPYQPGSGNSWNSELIPGRRDDVAFLQAVTADAARRFGFPRDQVVAAGFSNGGMMIWRLACDTPDAFAAFAPMSGALMRPLPETCKGPVRLLHTHGWSDQTVPLEGKAMRAGLAVQGDLFDQLALLRRTSGCASDAPDSIEQRSEYLIRRWSSCDAGADIVFALHPGGHEVPEGWPGLVLDWFEAPGAPLASEGG